jgi:hypothetical protein
VTNKELEALEKLEKAATPIYPIPSVIRESGCKHPVGTTFVFHARDIGRVVATFTEEQNAREYIATSGALPALIAAARENARLRAVVEAARVMHDAGVDPRNGPAGKALAELALALEALDAFWLETEEQK